MIACFQQEFESQSLFVWVGEALVVLPQAGFIPASAQGLLMGGPYAVPKSNID